MMARVFLFFVGVLFSTVSWGVGDQKENGGDVIFCQKDGAVTVELLDMYEGRVTYDFTYAPSKASTLADIFNGRVGALEHWNPTRAQLYREYFKSFSQEVKFLPPGNGFSNIGDEGWATIPQGCSLKQVVVQQDIPTPGGIRYFVDGDLWGQLSEESKAALLMHEFIYREGRLPKNNFRNSTGVRYFNALIHSDAMSNMSLKQYIAHLRYVGFQEAEAQGQAIALFTWNKDFTLKTEQSVDFSSDNIVTRATLTDHFHSVTLNGLGPEVSCHLPVDGDHSIWFFESGRVAIVNIGCEPQAIRFKNDNGQGYAFGSTFTYDETGALMVITISSDRARGSSAVFSDQSSTYQLQGFFGVGPGSMDLLLYPSGALKSIQYAGNVLTGWLMYQGKKLAQNDFLLHPGPISFLENGTIAEFPLQSSFH